MKIIHASYELMTPIEGKDILKKIEQIARTCYKSEEKISDGSAERMIVSLIANNHEAMLEHQSITVKFIVDRGVSHEIVRHRMASFAQESTRYCNYSQDKFDGEITVIKPLYLDEGTDGYNYWKDACLVAENSYFKLLDFGCTPQEARAVLPTSLKTEICMTANLREWRHFFNLRAAGTTGKPHPQMKEVAVPLLYDMHSKIPYIFDDIIKKVEFERWMKDLPSLLN